MSQVKITIGGKIYSIACGPGEEEKVAKLGAMIDENYAKLGTARAPLEADNLVFAALFMADELDEMRQKVSGARTQVTEAQEALKAAKDEAANAVQVAEAKFTEDKDTFAERKTELKTEIETLRKAEERSRQENAALKADIAELQERARHQHDMFGGPAEDAALSEAMAEKLEAIATRAEATASELEASAS